MSRVHDKVGQTSSLSAAEDRPGKDRRDAYPTLFGRVRGKVQNWQLNAPLWRARQLGYKIVVFNVVVGFHYDYIEPLLLKLRHRREIRWWIIVYHGSDGLETVLARGIPRERILLADSAIELKCVDAFISPTTFTSVPKGQVECIQLFHGLAGWGSSKSGDPKMNGLTKFNRLFVAGPNMERTIARDFFAFHPDHKQHTAIYPVGYPKTDSLFANGQARPAVVKHYGLDAGKPIVLYAPSWEKQASLHTSGDAILRTLANLDASILIKLHSNCLTTDPQLTGGVNWREVIGTFCDQHPNCRMVAESNANSFLAAADLLVTDVSGVGFEYLLLDKPVVYYDCPEFFAAYGTAGIEHWGRSAGEVVGNPDRLRAAVQRALHQPNEHKAARAEIVSQLVFNPGAATEVAVASTLEILGLARPRPVAETPGPARRGQVLAPQHPPLVSICLPNLNARPFLEERLETILKQTVADWELIVCDSFSDDGSWEFLQKFKADPRVRLYQVPREGLYAGWNECLRRVTGEHLYIATADDTARPELLERLLEPLERLPELHISLCDHQPIDAEGQPLDKLYPKNAPSFYGEWMKVPHIRNGRTEFLTLACLGTTWRTMTAVLFRRELLRRVGFFRTDRGSAADEEWTMRAALASDIAWLPERLATWRVHERQATPPAMTDQQIRLMLDSVQSVVHDRRTGIPEDWKTIPDWDDQITRVWRQEYLDTFGLYRGQARRHPGQFFENAWDAFREEPGFFFRQAFRRFAWSDEFSPDKVQATRDLIRLFNAPWPPQPLPAARPAPAPALRPAPRPERAGPPDENREPVPPVPAGIARPLWTVIIPTYNCAHYLRDTLASVLAQDPGPDQMQIIVVDDHSTKDDPRAVVEELGGGRIEFYRQPHNVGPARNYQSGLNRSRGQLIHLLHGDDCAREGFYRAMQRPFAEHPDIGVAICRHVDMNERGEWQDIVSPLRAASGILDNWLEQIAHRNSIVTHAVVARREVYETLGGFDHRLTGCEDWEMWTRMAAHYRVWYELEPLVLYRRHAQSNTEKFARSGEIVRDQRRAIAIIRRYLPAATADWLTRRTLERCALVAIDRAGKRFARGDSAAAKALMREAVKQPASARVGATALGTLVMGGARLAWGTVRSAAGGAPREEAFAEEA